MSDNSITSNNYDIIPENTAISNGVSKSTRLLIESLENNELEDTKDFKILDYGCGLLRNTKELSLHSKKVDILDTTKQIERIKNKEKCYRGSYTIESNILPNNYYHRILCSFVINVIEKEEDRQEVIKRIYKCLKPNGIAFIEVRNKNFVKKLKNFEKMLDGSCVIGNGKKRTYQHPYTKKEFVEFVNSINNVDFNIMDTKTGSDSIILVLRKN